MDTLPGWLKRELTTPLSAAQTAAFAAHLHRHAPELKPWLNSVAASRDNPLVPQSYWVVIQNRPPYEHAKTCVRITKTVPPNQPDKYQAACFSRHVRPAPPCPRNLGTFPTLPQALSAAAHHCARCGEDPANIDQLLQHAVAIRNRPL